MHFLERLPQDGPAEAGGETPLGVAPYVHFLLSMARWSFFAIFVLFRLPRNVVMN